MAIITVSRELAALGDETAHELSSRLDYRFVDKNALEAEMKAHGVSGRKFQKYDEKKPSFFASLSHDRDDYLHFLKSAVLEEAGKGNAVFIGRGAGLILKGVPGVISIFLAAPPEVRVQRVKSYFHCDDRRARQIIEQSDSDREGFHRYFFDAKWKDPDNYHLVLNTGFFRPDLCAEIVKTVRDNLLSDEVEAQSARRMREITLEQKIKHHIIYDKGVQVHFLEASVSENRVSLYGVTNAQSLIEAAVSAAAEIAGDYPVHSEIQVMQEYSVMP